MTNPDYSSGASDNTSKSAAPTASDTAQQAAQRVRTEAVRVAGQAQAQAQTFLSQQKDAAAGHIESVSQVLHHTIDELRQRSPGIVSDYAERAVEGLDSFAHALREQDARSLIGTAEDFARRRPALFVAGSVALGFALARFLKSSAKDGYGQGEDLGQPPRSQSSSASGDRSGTYGRSGSPSTEHQSRVTTEQRGSDRKVTAEEIERAMSKESD